MKRPNIIWIFGDQHRAQALSCMGDPNLQTPHLDRLATTTRTAVAGIPLCSPFRGSLLTSQYPHHCVPAHDYALPDHTPTVATAFKSADYHTAYFGKWHIDGTLHRNSDERPAFQHISPHRRGDFDVWIGYENNNAQYDCWVHGHDASGNPIERYQLPGYETDGLTDLLLDYLNRQQTDSPFFAVLSVQPPHSPYVAPPEFRDRHDPDKIQLRPNVPPVDRIQEKARQDLAGYYAMIENLDWNVGRIQGTLSSTGLADNTILLFFSDHGDMHGSQGRILKCVPWEESIRIPFLVAGPNIDTSRASYQDLINHVDIAPTTLGLCNIDIPETMVGADYSGYFHPNRPKPTPDSAYLQLVDPGWKYGFASDRERPWRGVLTNDGWKYAVLEGQPWLLYNLNEDPFETANLALDGRFKTERKRLQDRLQGWIQDTEDTFHLPDV